MVSSNQTNEYILVTVSGPDGPGITSKLMNIIVQGGATLADIGQAVTHGLLSLSILIEATGKKDDYPVIKDLLFEAKKLGLSLNFDFILNNGEAFQTPGIFNGERFILNCVSSETISAEFMRDVAQTMAAQQVNIHRIDNITPGGLRCLELTTIVAPDVDLAATKKELLLLSDRHHVDMAFLRDNVFRRNKRLIVFDMDSTLIQTEVIDELAEAHGVGAEIKSITSQAMNGQMDFDESLQKRVSKLKGLDESKMRAILENLPITPGAPEFIKTVKGLGYKVALISGGFTYFANALKEKLGLDYAFANELEISNGKLTGGITGTIINANQKAMLLKVLAQQLEINLEQVVAIGDGANDLPMLSAAGLGIAYHAKEIVKQKAGHHFSHGPMTSILYFLGIPGPQV